MYQLLVPVWWIAFQSMSSPCFSINIVKWSSQGMLRLTQEAMNELFQPTINNIIKHIGRKNMDGFTNNAFPG